MSSSLNCQSCTIGNRYIVIQRHIVRPNLVCGVHNPLVRGRPQRLWRCDKKRSKEEQGEDNCTETSLSHGIVGVQDEV